MNVIALAWSRLWKSSASLRYAALTAFAMIMLGIAVVTGRTLIYQSEVKKGLAVLNDAYHTERPFEARLTGFSHAPFVRTRGSNSPNINDILRGKAERILFDNLDEHPAPESNHALGKFYLADKQFDKAISLFEKAITEEPSNSQFHSDLGAALLEKVKINKVNKEATNSSDASRNNLEEFARSLEYFNKAIELNPSALEALFNRALLYQEMALPKQAEEDCRRYLEKESRSEWADEVRDYLKQLEQQNQTNSQGSRDFSEQFLRNYQAQNDDGAWNALRQSRSRLGSSVIQELLDSYFKSKDTEALKALAYAGNLEAQKAQDHFTLDLSRFYNSQTLKGALEIAQARVLLMRAHDYYNRSELEAALTRYDQAGKIFERYSDTCESLLTEYWIGYCYFQKPDTKRSLSIFTQLTKACEEKKYVWLLSVSLNALANIHMRLGEYSKGIECYNRALLLSEQLSDENGILRSFDRLAGSFYVVGRYHDSLSSVEKGLYLALRVGAGSSQVVALYATAAASFIELGFHEAALDYLQQAVGLGLETGNPLIISRYYVQLGLAYARLKKYDAALEKIEAGFQIGQNLKTQSVGQEILAYTSLKLADVYSQMGEFSKAIANYDQVTSFYSKFENPEFVFLAHKGRLLAYMAQGDNSSAEEELKTLMRLLEEYRSKIIEESNRNSFFDVEQDIYDVAIEFAYSFGGGPQKAFDYSEMSKARSLLDMAAKAPEVLAERPLPELLISSNAPPRKLSDIQQQMPEEAQILQYALLENDLLIWVVSKDKLASEKIQVKRKDLNSKILDYLQNVAGVSNSANEQAACQSEELYELLIKPVIDHLDPAKEICIVPDKVLGYLPFGALISPGSGGRYFIQDHRFVVCPSSNMFLFCSDTATRKAATNGETLLSVGDPSFDRRAFPSLVPLESAKREAKDITQYYRAPQLLTGSEATKSRVLKVIGKSDVVHFAVHCDIDEKSPMLSKLLLAKPPPESASTGSDAVLRAYEIYGLKLLRARLAVLSACRTSIEGYYKGEGAVGISRPFLAAGVPLVVSSLWPVDTGPTADLMISFHKNRKTAPDSTPVSTSEALRQAQLSLIEGPVEQYRKPFYWAGFIVLGGNANF